MPTLEEDMDLDGAERWYRLAATADVMDAIADLGLLLLKEARYDEAEPWLRKAAASTDPEPQINQQNAGLLGACLLELGQLDEAEQWLVIAADAGLDFASKLWTDCGTSGLTRPEAVRAATCCRPSTWIALCSTTAAGIVSGRLSAR